MDSAHEKSRLEGKNGSEATNQEGRSEWGDVVLAYYLFDVALAVENMLLAATDLGLVTHPMTGVNEAELKKALGIPDEIRFVVATPLAYPAQNSYDEAAGERLSQRTRKDLPEIVYYNAWGKAT